MTPDELAYVRRMLGQYACEFTTDQLNDYYGDADLTGAANLLNGAVALAYNALVIGAVELTNYRQGETQENEAIIYDRLNDLYMRWYNQAGFPAPLPTFSMQQIQLGYVTFPEEETE